MCSYVSSQLFYIYWFETPRNSVIAYEFKSIFWKRNGIVSGSSQVTAMFQQQSGYR